MVKVVGIVRVMSVILFLIALGLVYAYLPVMVKVWPGDGGILLHKEYFFYYTVAIFFVLNLFTWGLIQLSRPLLSLKGSEEFSAWFESIRVILNIYLTLLLAFIGVINNPLHVSAEGFAYLNFVGPVLLLIWFIGIFYLSFKKKSTS
jgi:hypothetical protein